MKRSDLNHLRRLVAWVECEIGQSPDELVTTMRNMAERGITTDDAGKARMVKVSTRTELARRWPDLIDIDAGRIATGRASIEELGWELFHYYLDVASGKQHTWAEQHKLHNDITLFNPAPIT